MAEEQKDPQLVHKFYQYHIQAFEILFPEFKEPVKIARGAINAMYIEKDYDNNFYPIFSVSLVINPRLKDFISMNRDQVRFHIRLQCDICDNSGMVESTVDEFNAIFMPIIGDPMPFMDDEMYQEAAEWLNRASSDGETIDLSKNMHEIDANTDATYYLYAEHDLVGSKAVVNNVYNGTVKDVLVATLADNGFNAILMTPPNDDSAGQQIIVPPMNLIKIFDHMNSTYGMYDSGVIKFFDWRCVYILDKSGHPRCTDEGEYPTTVVTIFPTKTSESKLPGTATCDETKEYFVFPNPLDVQIFSDSDYANHLFGSNLTLINAQTNSSSTISSTGNTTGGAVTRVGYNNQDNAMAKSEYATSVSENNVKIAFMLHDFLMFAMTPNKEFIVNWVDSKVHEQYSGFYRPTKATYSFTKNGDSLALTGRIDMVKKEDISQAVKEATERSVNPRKVKSTTIGGKPSVSSEASLGGGNTGGSVAGFKDKIKAKKPETRSTKKNDIASGKKK